jgi:RNA polymerase sigma-70 factor, ECF subfamily
MEQAFTGLINNHRALIFKVCNLYCRDPEVRQDLFQEIVLQLWKSFPHFRHNSAAGTWIYRVALNTAISNYRREQRTVERTQISTPELNIPEINDDSDGPEKRSLLHQAINQLSDIERAIMMLYLDEKNYEEISEILGLSISNVGVRINRIKSKLSERLKTY